MNYLTRARSRSVVVYLALIAALMVLARVEVLASEQARHITTGDLFRMEQLDDTAVSPDGKWLAYVLKRPKMTATHHKLDFLFGTDYADIWLVSTTGGESLNITKGAADGTGYWGPAWSPDSERLALLSTLGGNVRMWVWERRSGRLKQLTERGVEPGSRPVWLSDHVVACAVLPEGKRPLMMTAEVQMAEVAMREWPKAWAGKEVTANVLDTDLSCDYDKRPKGALVFSDVQKETSWVVAVGDFGSLTLSPDKRYLAALEQTGVVQPRPEHLLVHILQVEHQLALFSADGNRLDVRKADANIISGSIRWAPNGTKLAVMGRTPDLSNIYLYKVGEKSLEIATGGDIIVPASTENPSGIMWSENGDLILQAEKKATASEIKAARKDWWFVTAPGQSRNLTGELKSAPAQLLGEPGGSSFVGIADEKVWRVFTDGSKPVEITSGTEPKITSIVWPSVGRFESAAKMETSTYREMIVGSGKGMDITLHWLDLRSGKIEPLPIPNSRATLASYDPHKKQAVFTANLKEGTYLWLASEQSTARTIVETNTFLRNITPGESKKIEYISLDGQELKAWLLLPPGYQQEKRYPMVVWVYAGSMMGEKPYALTEINNPIVLNLQVLAAQGYVVLVPSMPLKPEGEPSDPYMELPKGVLPAVEKAIELGYADAARVGVMGQSYGGYSTYGLITQTNRFKAAVSLAGLSNLVSLYGVFDARFRYEQFPHEVFFRMSGLETGYGRMGNPPWKDLGRYLRNSPIFYVDRVETPLMIIQGDMDFIAIQQGEEFFTALYRQHKRAQFVRYWGEGHVLGSPANIRDMWQRIDAWLDEHLDVARDQQGNLLWDGEKPASRNGAPPLKPEDFARFDEMLLKPQPAQSGR